MTMIKASGNFYIKKDGSKTGSWNVYCQSPIPALPLYYAIEQQTDLYSLNSGVTWSKIGFNDRDDEPKKTPVTYIVIDNMPHLTARDGLESHIEN